MIVFVILARARERAISPARDFCDMPENLLECLFEKFWWFFDEILTSLLSNFELKYATLNAPKLPPKCPLRFPVRMQGSRKRKNKRISSKNGWSKCGDTSKVAKNNRCKSHSRWNDVKFIAKYAADLIVCITAKNWKRTVVSNTEDGIQEKNAWGV